MGFSLVLASGGVLGVAVGTFIRGWLGVADRGAGHGAALARTQAAIYAWENDLVTRP